MSELEAPPTFRPHPLRRLLHAVQPWLRKEATLTVFALIVFAFEVVLLVAQPLPLKPVFDQLLGPSRAPAPFGLEPAMLLVAAAVMLAALWAARALVSTFVTNIFARLGRRVIVPFGNEAYGRFLRAMPPADASAERTAAAQLCRDLSRAEDILSSDLRVLMTYVLMLLGIVGALFAVHWQLALLIALTAPVVWIRGLVCAKRAQAEQRTHRAAMRKLQATASDSLASILEIQAFAFDKRFAKDFVDRHAEVARASLEAVRASSLQHRSIEALTAAAAGLGFWLAGYLATSGAITRGDVVLFLAYAAMAYMSARPFAAAFVGLQRSSRAVERVLDRLERIVAVIERPVALDASNLRGEVKFESVDFSFDQGPPILVGVDFHAKPGQLVALVGPPGGGKSAVVSLIPRLRDVTHGRVTIDGEDVRHYGVRSLRKQITVILNDTLLFSGKVWENIAAGGRHVTRAEIESAARMANAHDFISALPEGYATQVGVGGVQLSHGQRQRLAIARAIVHPTPILVLDRPTDGLDEEDRNLIMEPLMRLARGRTTFLVTDDLNLAALADLIVYIERGRVAEVGSHADLVRLDDRYAAAYRRHAAARSASATRPQDFALTG